MTFSRVLLSLCIAYQFSSSQVGPNGQDCSPGTDDNPPDACPLNENTFTSLTGSVIECEENFDCCYCSSISCGGGGSAGRYCDKFVAGGDSSAFFVGPISITGSANDGATIECGGDSSCEGTQITGTNIKELKCGGDRSCYAANWSLQCITKDPCDIECDGDEACRMAQIAVNNVEKVKCGSEMSCREAVFTITNPQNEIEIECGDSKSCKEMELDIIITADAKVNTIKGIKCGGYKACQRLVVYIDNQQSNKVTVEMVECNGGKACKHAVFRGNNVEFSEIKCDGSNVCSGCIIGGESCQSVSSSALITEKRTNNSAWGVLSSVDPVIKWILLSICIVFCICIMICCAYVCIGKAKRENENDQDDIELHIQQEKQRIKTSIEMGYIANDHIVQAPDEYLKTDDLYT